MSTSPGERPATFIHEDTSPGDDISRELPPPHDFASLAPRLLRENQELQTQVESLTDRLRVAESCSIQFEDANRTLIERHEYDVNALELAHNLISTLTQEGRIDPLTGAANRRGFEKSYTDLQKQRAHAQRTGDAAKDSDDISDFLIYVDLDDFKLVNDTGGHEKGDELLKAVGLQLTAVVRQEDTVARLGGDEFALILTGMTNEQIFVKLKELHDGILYPLGISASIGISPIDVTKQLAYNTRQADKAMYCAKTAKTNRTADSDDNRLASSIAYRQLPTTEVPEPTPFLIQIT
jgi:diguanylate cyclase (GGDEF)-like protein